MDYVQSELSYDVTRTDLVWKFILITKPGIVFGNLISVVGGFWLASRGRIDLELLLFTIVGVGLVIASGCVLNNRIDQELDRKMTRTQNRVLARGLMSPYVAVVFALILGVAGTTILVAATNLLCVSIVLAGLVIYAGVYSLCLKRRSLYAIVIGSIAGAAPPLAGYCAAGNHFDLGAILLLIIFALWQIPHSHAIALCHLSDFSAASLPVLPVIRGISATKKQIIAYIPAFTIAALMLTLTGYTGWWYLTAVIAVGAVWFYRACSGYKTMDDRYWAKKMFIFSIIGIVVLNIMLVIDFT